MYVLLGANGNITSKAARILLSHRNNVRVVGRNAARLEPLRQAGAQLAIGDIADVEFLSGALRGAQAVYTMIPPQCPSRWSTMRGLAKRSQRRLLPWAWSA